MKTPRVAFFLKRYSRYADHVYEETAKVVVTEVKTQTADSSSRTANSDSPVGHTDAGPDVTPADTVCTAYPSGLEGVHGRKRVELAACPRDSRGADHYIRARVYIYTRVITYGRPTTGAR